MNQRTLVKSFIFKDPVFDGRTLDKLRDHPVFGPAVQQWIAQGRTDWWKMKAQLRVMQNRARRQRKWLTIFEKSGRELEACEKTLVSYATFYGWKLKDEEFRIKYQAIREMYAMSLVEKARLFASAPENATDRWNLIKTEVPEYNPKKDVQKLTVNFNSDIEFSPRKGAIETTAEDPAA